MRQTIKKLSKQFGIHSFLKESVNYKNQLHKHYIQTPKFISKRKHQINEYLKNNQTVKLNIACGGRILNGWINTDLEPEIKECIYLDACNEFPFGNESIHFITCEQFIEHINPDQGQFFVKECYRILKPDGVLRIATPCIDRYIKLFDTNALKEEDKKFITEFQKFHNLPEVSAEIILNYMFYHWGHQNLYTKSALTALALKFNFKEVFQVRVNESKYEDLRNIEKHQEYYGDFLNEYSTMVFELKK